MNFNYSRCLDPEDYELFSEHELVTKEISKHNIYRYEHPHRKWEYGLTLKFLLELKAESVIDVGGGGSVLAPLLAKKGVEASIIDPYPESDTIENQNKILEIDLKYIQEDFLKYKGRKKVDSVVSISTIEHLEKMEDVEKFIDKMFKLSKKGVFLTMDFHPSGKAFSVNHYRTFTNKDLRRFVAIGKKNGFILVGDPNWYYNGEFVYDYTFASLAMVKE